jgi:hypothetical protein
VIDLFAALYLIVALAALAALALFFVGLRQIKRRRVITGAGGCMLGVLVALFAALVGVIGLSFHAYQRLTAEQPVAKISFIKLGPQYYQAILRRADGQRQVFNLHGDAWQLDARVIKWQGFATVLGFDTLYRLERISGRYDSMEQARTAPRSVASLSPHPGLDLWRFIRRHADWLPWIDASYGSATYLPMGNGAAYRVTISTTGLLARPANPAARRAVAHWP